MTLNDLLNQIQTVLEAKMSDYQTIERYITQFNPEQDEKLTFVAPGLFYNIVSGTKSDETKPTYDVSLLIAFVIARDDLDALERDAKGWIDTERLMVTLEGISGFAGQANVPFLQAVNKTDRQDAEMNAGYSYWAVLVNLDWRLHGVTPGSY